MDMSMSFDLLSPEYRFVQSYFSKKAGHHEKLSADFSKVSRFGIKFYFKLQNAFLHKDLVETHLPELLNIFILKNFLCDSSPIK